MKEIRAAAQKWLESETHAVWLEYGGLSLIILLPLLLPGYILTLDLVFTPNFAWPADVTNTYPLQIMLWLAHWIIPGDVIEKIILFLILLLSGAGMHKLVRQLKFGPTISADTARIAAYFAGMFYMINPFTYSRFMAGQWMVLLGYALVPFFVATLLRLVAAPTRKTALQLTLWALAIITVSLHHAGILLLLSVLIAVIAMVKYWQKKTQLRCFLGYLFAGGLLVIAASSFWLLPAVLGQGSIVQVVASFDQTDAAAFATNGHGALGAIGQVIRLQGFWAESRQLYALPQSLMPMWGVVFLLLWALVIFGGVKAWRNSRTIVLVAAGCIIVGIILAATPVMLWLSQWLPFARGYREPHKFASLIVIGYSILGAFGTAYMLTWARKRFKENGSRAATIAFLLLPLALTPTMLWGFAGQLTPRAYPDEWYEMNKTLKATTANDRVLFLPWHQYAHYDFSERVMANPAEKFFEVPMIISDDPEFRHVSPTVPDDEKRAVSAALKHPADLPRVLASHNIHYILLAKEKNQGDYSYLDTLPGIHVLNKTTKLTLYRVGDTP